MKTRNGFVSNSSSSSFVVVGIEMEVSDELSEALCEDNSEFSLLNWYSDNRTGVCCKIASWDDDDYSDMEVDLEDVKEIEEKLQKRFKTSIKAKVYVGRRYS